MIQSLPHDRAPQTDSASLKVHAFPATLDHNSRQIVFSSIKGGLLPSGPNGSAIKRNRSRGRALLRVLKEHPHPNLGSTFAQENSIGSTRRVPPIAAEYPMQFVAGHIRPLKAAIEDPQAGIIDAPVFLTLFIDGKSFANIAFNLNHDPSIATLCCLHRALSPNSNAYGSGRNGKSHRPRHRMIPHLIITEPSDCHNRQLRTTTAQLGIDLIFQESYLKRAADRIIDDINDYLLSAAPKSNLRRSTATFTEAALSRLLHKYLIGGCNHAYHIALDASPASVLKNSTPAGGLWRAPSRQHDLDLAFAVDHMQPVSSQGIFFEGLRYTCPELTLYQKEVRHKMLAIKVMPWDMSRIFVSTGKGQIEVPAEKASYTQGLSLDRHRAIVATLRSRWRKREANPAKPKQTGPTVIMFPNHARF